MTPIELLERALADAIACNAIAVKIEVTAADGTGWIYVSEGADLDRVWDAADRAVAS